MIFGAFLIISGYKKPLTEEQIEKCKIIFELKNEAYGYNKCYKLFNSDCNKDFLISVVEKWSILMYWIITEEESIFNIIQEIDKNILKQQEKMAQCSSQYTFEYGFAVIIIKHLLRQRERILKMNKKYGFSFKF